MSTQTLFLGAISCLFTGFLFLGLASASYRWRAFLNKRAWNGLTKPLLAIGLIVVVLGIILVYIFYPFE